MNKKILFSFSLSILAAFGLNAQLVNNGATITIESGAKLFVEGDVQNLSSGTITNNGIVEIQGNLTNTGSNLNGTNIYVFSGTTDSNIDAGGESIGTVRMKKTSGNIVLTSALAIDDSLNFVTAGKVMLGDNDLTLAPAALVNGDATKYVVADAVAGTGKMVKTTAAAGTFTFPVGDLDDYTPLTSIYSGAGSVATNVADGDVADVPCQTDAKISRAWNVTSTGGITQSLTGEFIAAGDETLIGGASNSLIKGAIKSGTEWFYINSVGTTGDDVGVDVAAAQTDVVFTGTNIFGKLNAKVFLQGATNAGGTAMSTNLNALIPNPSPYTSFDRSSTPSGAADAILGTYTDWLEIEARDGAGTTVLSTVDAFVNSDGFLKDVCDNTSTFAYLKDAPNNANIGIGHRNHLGVRTVTAIDLTDNMTMLDFSTTTNIFNAGHANAPMATVGGANALWGGDANGDGQTRYLDFFDFGTFTTIPSDALVVLTKIGNITNAFVAGYESEDVNLDGQVRYLDFFDFGTFTTIPSDALNLLGYIGNLTNNSRIAHLD